MSPLPESDRAGVRTPCRAVGRGLLALLATVAVAAVLSRGALHAEAPSQPTALLLVDGSRSMWGTLDGDRVHKIYQVRNAVRQVLPKLAPTMRVGLASFGHRRAGECTDIEVIVPPTAGPDGGGERIVSILDKFNPRGRGPIADGLRAAAQALKGEAGAKSIVLIHDDPDNCKGDPCEAAVEIKAAQPGLVIHVIALGPKREEMQRLRCVSNSTGGRYVEAASQAALLAALEETITVALGAAGSPTASSLPPRTAAPQPGPAGPLKPKADTDKRPGLHLMTTLVSGGPPVDLPVRWRVMREGAQDVPIYEELAVNPVLLVRPGRYTVELDVGIPPILRSTFIVGANEATLGPMVLDAGLVRVRPVLHKSGPTVEGASIVVQRAGEPNAPVVLIEVSRDRPAMLLLKAGTYNVSAGLGLAKQSRTVTVAPGRQDDLELVLGTGILRVALATREGGRPIDTALFTVLEDDPDAPQGRREVARSAAARPEFALAAGTYYVVARHGYSEARERVALKAGETIERVLVAPTAGLTLRTKVAGAATIVPELVSYRLQRLDITDQDPVITSAPEARYALAAGRYRIEGRYGLLNARVVREIELKAGQDQQLLLEHQAALLTLKLAEGGVLPGAGDAYWEIRDQRGTLVWATGQSEPRAPLLPGRYNVRVEQREKSGETTVELRSGETRAIDVAPK